MTSTELGIPERWIVWVWVNDPPSWVTLGPKFSDPQLARQSANCIVGLRRAIVSTATGEVVWDSEAGK